MVSQKVDQLATILLTFLQVYNKDVNVVVDGDADADAFDGEDDIYHGDENGDVIVTDDDGDVIVADGDGDV